MPKGGSGFLAGAGKAAAAVQRGVSGWWRLANPDAYTEEIVKAYQQLYRSGGAIVRNSRGEVKRWDAKLEQLRKLYDIADRMAQNVQEYQPEQAYEYSRLRQTWGKPVYVNSREMAEFRKMMQHGDTMLINPRGRRGIASDAENTAREGGYSYGKGNVDTLLEANRQLNAAKKQIWQNARKVGGSAAVEGYRREIYDQLANRYLKTERAAWRRRKNK